MFRLKTQIFFFVSTCTVFASGWSGYEGSLLSSFPLGMEEEVVQAREEEEEAQAEDPWYLRHHSELVSRLPAEADAAGVDDTMGSSVLVPFGRRTFPVLVSSGFGDVLVAAGMMGKVK